MVRHYLAVLNKRKWLISAVALTAIATAAVQSFTVTPIYTATAQLQIDLEALNVLPYEDVARPPSFYYEETYQLTQHRILGSKALARRVANKLGLGEDLAFASPASPGLLKEAIPRVTGFFADLIGKESSQAEQKLTQPSGSSDRAANLLVAGVAVTPDRGTRLVNVSYSCPNPRLAAQIANTLVDEYIELGLETRFKAATMAAEFLETELEQLRIKVEESEEDLVQYARLHGIVDVGAGLGQESIVLQKLAALNAEMATVQAELIARSVQYEAARNATLDTFPESLKSAAIRQLEGRVAELGQKLAGLSARYGPEYVELNQVRRELHELEDQLISEQRKALGKVRSDYQLAWDHYRSISAAVEEQKERAGKLNEDSIQYHILEREVDSNKRLYEGLLQRLKQAGVSAGLRSSNLHVIEHASPPKSPSGPLHSRNLLLGLVAGLVLGVGLAFAIDYFDNTVKTPDDLEQFAALPSLGVIPRIEPPGARRRSVASAESQGKTGVGQYVAPDDGGWEAYRKLRTSILLSHAANPPRTLLVTSALPSEGKTTTAINMAIVLAQTGARALLVDLEMRKPELGRKLGFNGPRGMSIFLSGNSDLSSQILKAPYDNLYVIPAGPIPPNPAELVGSARWQQALALLHNHFDYIVIDSPPVLSVADPLILSQQVDGVVLVVRAGKTPRNAMWKAKRALDSVGASVLGAIINDVDLGDAAYAHYYRHCYSYAQ